MFIDDILIYPVLHCRLIVSHVPPYFSRSITASFAESTCFEVPASACPKRNAGRLRIFSYSLIMFNWYSLDKPFGIHQIGTRMITGHCQITGHVFRMLLAITDHSGIRYDCRKDLNPTVGISPGWPRQRQS